VITKFNFNSLFRKAWFSALLPPNLVFGFQKGGVYPFNADTISIPNNCVQNCSHNEGSVTVANPLMDKLVVSTVILMERKQQSRGWAWWVV